MALERYRQKRDFTITPEPEGTVRRSTTGALSFLVQKHAATRLHYDFRLELNGVLLSWAVPKGPSLDPNEKRLAMHTEDHPLEYGDFEGVIPAKQYGGGTVMLWDRGIWLPKGDPVELYRRGRLKFDLVGEKLRGGWNLIRSKSTKYGGTGESWLLIKEADEHARLGAEAAIVDDKPLSVATGRDMPEIARDQDRTWHSNRSAAENAQAASAPSSRPRSAAARDLGAVIGAKKAALPDFIEPQLAMLVKTPPSGENWVHEVKYDGYRMLCHVARGRAHVVSRNGKDWTSEFSEIARALARLPLSTAWIDGEVAVVDAAGRSSFQALQNVLSNPSAGALTYFAFDLPYLDGYDLRAAALADRKRVLAELLADPPPGIRYSDHFVARGDAFRDNVCALGLEGMVSKRVDLPYTPQRGSAWQKVKCERRQDMVVGGFTDPGGSRLGFGALLLGHYEADGSLVYAGRVGTGFDDATLIALRSVLDPLVTMKPAFRNPPRGYEAKGAHWVEPQLVAEVAFTEWTDEGTLRHPSFVALRPDKSPRDAKREDARPPSETTVESRAEAAPESSANATASGPRKRAQRASRVTLSNADKVLYPEAGITKGDLARYYEAIARWILPHLENRPLTLVRCPNGWDQPCFYQKNADASVIDAVERVDIRTSDGGTSHYMMANSLDAVLGMVQLGALELHPWGSRKPTLAYPDRIIFDLDPDDGVSWDALKEAVLLVRTLLTELGLAAFLKTTGGKGLHVVVPIEPTVDWTDVKGFTKTVAELLERTFPERFTSKLLKVSRRGRIFIDYLRNTEGATAVAAYSVRAKAHATVSLPIDWTELADDVRFARFTVANVPKRLAKAADPWAGLQRETRELTRATMARVLYTPQSA